ncbi:GxxExxY protein [Novipirellula rosea]|uniref:GxxExxY protein n=1 Tax=Novipirellula rosea TaxID=1031540 RepID=A0ABP8MVY2_9BACT
MPILLPIDLPRITESQMREIDYQVMGYAFSIHNELGRLCDEQVYQSDFVQRIYEASLCPVYRELPVVTAFRTFSKTFKLDCIVAGGSIYELKTVARLNRNHFAQLLNYLLLTNTTRGKLINFRPKRVQTRFVNTSLTLQERRRFSIQTSDWQGNDSLVDLVDDLLSDWGTGLATSLYRQAILHFLGGSENLYRLVPMSRGGHSLGNQHFYLIDDISAFFVTTMNQAKRQQHCEHLVSLLRHSPIRYGHWVNIDLHAVQFTTLVST